MTHTDTWKDTERWVAKRLCARRVAGNDHSTERDVESKYLSVEVKHRISAIPASVRNYLAQIKRNSKRGTIGFVFAHTPGTRRDNAVVYIEFKDFERLLKAAGFVPCQDAEDEV